MIKVIHGQIYSEDFSKLNQLAKDYSSCVRYCYSRFKKDKLKFNDVRNLAKEKYQSLNTRQVSDACLEGQSINTRHKDKSIIFGGRKLFQQRKNNQITKEQYQQKRDCKIYARGDATKSGNPNIRIYNDKLRITVGNRKFEYYDLFIPQKYQNELEELRGNSKAYNVRLKRQDDTHWQVIIDYKIEIPKIIFDLKNGCIGIDINPDRIAISEIDKKGNLIESQSIVNSKLYDASSNKRKNEIGTIIKQIINLAKEKNKGIVFENLKFKKKFDWNKKFNRIKSNFIWKQFLELLERKCVQNGIEYKKVNPAYTSVIGRVKYMEMYNLTIHESAAFVIARRGLGFNEKVSIYKLSNTLVKEKILRTLEGKYKNKRIHNWVFWKEIKAVLTGLGNRMRTLQEVRDHFLDDSESLSSKVFQQQLIAGSNLDNLVNYLGDNLEKTLLGDERRLSKLL